MPTTLDRALRPTALAAAAIAVLAAVTVLVARSGPAEAADAPPAGAAAKAPAGTTKAALTVTVTTPQRSTWPLTLQANGSITAWQEASVGAEVNGLRLAEVRVNVGDVVRRGQVLATFAADTVRADLAQIKASVAEAEATAAAAAVDAERARSLQATGALSAQQIAQLLTAEQTARARLEAQRAAAQVVQLRLAQTQVLAPDAGVISARSATVGAVVPAGVELFRLIRQGRLEWRAEVPAPDLASIKPGQRVLLRPAGATQDVTGTVRMVAPTVDPATRNGLVYVDLGADRGTAKAGMFARGDFQIGQTSALTLPQSAVLLRDGFANVLVVGADNKVREVKVSTGRRQGDRVEIAAALPDGARVVASGGAFLADGDTVRVVDAAPPAPATPANPAQAPQRVALPATPAASTAR